jgi:hypothetical protein
MKTLTVETQQLAQGHVRLAHSLARREHFNRLTFDQKSDLDDLVSQCLLMICRCACYHDPAKGRFTTYCTHAIQSHWRQAHYRNNRPKRIPVRSDRGEVEVPAAASESEAHDHRAPAPIGADMETSDFVSRLRAVLGEEQFLLLWQRFAEDRPLADLGQERGVTRQMISLRIDKAIRQARELGG